jgi:hypothetical protein
MKKDKKPLTIKETFQLRSKTRMIIAYIFLAVAFGVLIYGMVLVIMQLSDLMSDTTAGQTKDYSANAKSVDSEAKKTFGPYEIGNFLARLVLLSVVFFLGNIFIRLYKYNMGVSDYYTACADSIRLSEDYEIPFLKKFVSVFKTLTASKVEFEVPQEPKVEQPETDKDKAG